MLSVVPSYKQQENMGSGMVSPRTVEELEMYVSKEIELYRSLPFNANIFAVNIRKKEFLHIFRSVYGSCCVYGRWICSRYFQCIIKNGVTYVVIVRSLESYVKCKVRISFLYMLCIHKCAIYRYQLRHCFLYVNFIWWVYFKNIRHK